MRSINPSHPELTKSHLLPLIRRLSWGNRGKTDLKLTRGGLIFRPMAHRTPDGPERVTRAAGKHGRVRAEEETRKREWVNRGTERNTSWGERESNRAYRIEGESLWRVLTPGDISWRSISVWDTRGFGACDWEGKVKRVTGCGGEILESRKNNFSF